MIEEVGILLGSYSVPAKLFVLVLRDGKMVKFMGFLDNSGTRWRSSPLQFAWYSLSSSNALQEYSTQPLATQPLTTISDKRLAFCSV